MSVSSLPEWKQLLLERKRREEEERERRGKEEEQKFASMPAWKRGIIQRRKAKQESLGDRERERDVCLLQVDVRPPSDSLSDTDSSVTVNLGSEPSLSPDPGLWLDADPKLISQVSVEMIVPVHENPFIRTQSVWRKGRDMEGGSEPEVKDREWERDKASPRGQDGEPARGRDIELKIERFRDLSEGREKERSRERSQGIEHSRERCEKDKGEWRESCKDVAKEQECFKIRKDTDEKEILPQPGMYSPLGPCLRTIRADNIIIIEQDSKGVDERRLRWREAEREGERAEEEGMKRGMKMDLREILAGGGSVTEIRASEVLIIKPSTSPEERSSGGKGREEAEVKGGVEVRRDATGRELRTDMSWLRGKEKERPWGQATVINKDEGNESLEDNLFVERGGRVSQLLSKFGEHPKPPSRSKSSDNFLHPGRCTYLMDQDDQESEELMADGKNALLKGVPKRSFSFSDRVLSARENGVSDEGHCERRERERIHSDRSGTSRVDATSLRQETAAKIKLGCARLLANDHVRNYRDTEVEKRSEAETCVQHRSEVRKLEPVDKRAAEKVVDADGDKGFTVASVKNTEGISFARRVPIRQDIRARAERETKRLSAEKSLERDPSVEKTSDGVGHIEAPVCNKGEGGLQSAAPPEGSSTTSGPADPVNASPATESHYRQDSAFTECSGLLCTVKDRPPHRGPDWAGTGSWGASLAHSVLSQHTEELISKIEKIGDTTVYTNERGERAQKSVHETPKQEEVTEVPESLVHDTTPRAPQKAGPSGVLHGPLEIQIPRTVFYVAEETLERKKPKEGQDWEGGREVERRDSWRIGKPLSRIESLREKIRQRELEKLREREAQAGEESQAAADNSDAQTAAGDRYEERGSETERDVEVTCAQRMLVDAEEDAASQASAAARDVTQEVGVLKTCPQLPVSGPHSQADRGEEAASNVDASEVTDNFQASKDKDDEEDGDDEDDPLKHVEEQLRRHRGRHKKRDDEQEEEGKEISEDQEVEEYTSHLDPTQTLSSSPPHPNSLAAMSRIYNLETVGSRSGLCLRERTVEISSSVHLVKVRPLVSNSTQADSRAFLAEEICGVQTIQRQIEQFQLKEQEVLKSCTSPNREAKGQHSPRGLSKDDAKDLETPPPKPKVSPQRVFSPTSHFKQTYTCTPSFLRSQSPDNSLKSTDWAPTPAPSPSSPSPAHSPSISPSPSSSPTLFSIKSASGGPVKRGATITISPIKAPAGGVATGSAVRPTPAGCASTKISSQQTQTTPAPPAESGKKKYPTVEEIEVIGGYQSLEKSCLVKKGGTPKRGKVCFDEEQLEHVCEYPSETFMLAFSPHPHQHPHDMLRMEKLQEAEAQDDEAEAAEGGAVVFKSARNVGIATALRLRVDESCP